MSASLRFILLLGALSVLCFVIHRIKRASFSTNDSIFWIILCVCLLIIAVAPSVAYFFSDLFGFESPSNFIFLVIIALLLIKQFSMQNQLVTMRAKLTTLIQEIALRDRTNRDNAN